MRNSRNAFLGLPAWVAAGIIAVFALQTSDALAAKSRKPPGDRDAEELDRPSDMADWMHAQRAYPATALPDSIYFNGWAEWTAVTQQPLPSRSGTEPFAKAAPPEWQLIGPVGLHYVGSGTPNMGPAAGRTTTFVIDPSSASTMYAGFALGGVWKSTDSGASWTALTD